MDSRSFFNLVSQMRAAQRAYFKTRDNIILEHSKELEHRVDDEINRVAAILVKRGENIINQVDFV